MKITGKKILITGGASGIGLALAEQFLKDNNTVIICGRRQTALEEAKSKFPGLIIYQGDISTAERRMLLKQWVLQHHNDLNILVNNAGIQNWMAPGDNDFFDRAKDEIAINIEAPVHLCSLFAGLKSIDTIMNVTSGLSFVPLIKVPVYCATKAFLHSYTISLRELLKPGNIDVIEIIPPALNTDLGGKGLHDHAPPVSDFIDSIFKQLEQGSKELVFGLSENVSKAGPDDLRKTFERMNQLQ
jgi:uncharacterized oxidoreductase